MMKIVNAIGFLSLTLGVASNAHAQTLEWTRQLGTSIDDQSFGVSADGLGNVYISGRIAENRDAIGEGADAFLSKYDASGTLQWTRQAGDREPDESLAVSADGLGSVYVSGRIRVDHDPPTSWDALLSKYDAEGALQWTRQFGTGNAGFSNGVSADGLGNVYTSGHTPGSDADVFINKYDADGTRLWTRWLGTAGKQRNHGISADGLGNVYITGETNRSLEGTFAGGKADAFISKFSASGALEWTRQLGTSGNDYGNGVSADGLGNIYITGETSGSLEGANAGSADAFVSKYDTSGMLQWTRQFGTKNYDASNGVSTDGVGGVYISGYTGGNLSDEDSPGSGDAFISKYSASGMLEWIRQFGSSSTDFGNGVSASEFGYVYVSGSTWGNLDGINAGGADAYVAKYNTDVPEPNSVILLLATFACSLTWRRLIRPNRVSDPCSLASGAEGPLFPFSLLVPTTLGSNQEDPRLAPTSHLSERFLPCDKKLTTRIGWRRPPTSKTAGEN